MAGDGINAQGLLASAYSGNATTAQAAPRLLGPFHINYDDDGLTTTGVQICEMTEGTLVTGFYVRVAEVEDDLSFVGTTPTVWLGAIVDDAFEANTTIGALNIGSLLDHATGGLSAPAVTSFTDGAVAAFSDGSPLYVKIDDGNGGDPGLTKGSGDVYLVAVPPS